MSSAGDNDMLEIEMKFRSRDPAAVARKLSALTAEPGIKQREIDHYWNAPDRDFGKTGEAFRIRRVGDANCFTFKGPRQTGTTAKIRTELELSFAAGDDGAATARQLLTHLGYRPVAEVRKSRTMIPLQRSGFSLTVCLDEVDELGHFVEIEILADDADRDRAEQQILDLARELGLTDHEPRSYLRMILEREGRA